jgi:hypothetical protein
MSTSNRPADKFGATRGKLMLVGALAVILFAVVYWNFFREAPGDRATATATPGRDGKASAPPSPTGTRDETPPVEATAASLRESNGPPQRVSWPDFELAGVAAFDPFAPSDQFPQPRLAEAPDSSSAAAANEPLEPGAETEQTLSLATIKEQGVELVMRNGQEYVARIGGKEVRVGDKIGDFRVVEIDLRGVTLEGDRSP